MDVDENTNQQGTNDIEQSFLQQFSCLGTTDHDELVSRFQKLLGNQLNYTTARFFLDMNNWNLHAAVGCYFDFYSGKLPSMQIVADVTVGEGEAVTPNTWFHQSWKVQNNGDERWPEGCYIKLTSVPDGQQKLVPALNPGETTVITMQILSPNECGSFQTKWWLCTPSGAHFGDTIWAIVQVTPTGTLAITQQLSNLHTAGLGNSSSGEQQNQEQSSSNQNYNQLSTVPIPLPPANSPTSNNVFNESQNSQPDDNDMC